MNIESLLSNPIFITALIAELVLKGIALWRCGRNNQPIWFIALLLINTAGVLPLIYLIAFQQNRNK
jgi:hypothetical protein